MGTQVEVLVPNPWPRTTWAGLPGARGSSSGEMEKYSLTGEESFLWNRTEEVFWGKDQEN